MTRRGDHGSQCGLSIVYNHHKSCLSRVVFAKHRLTSFSGCRCHTNGLFRNLLEEKASFLGLVECRCLRDGSHFTALHDLQSHNFSHFVRAMYVSTTVEVKMRDQLADSAGGGCKSKNTSKSAKKSGRRITGPLLGFVLLG